MSSADPAGAAASAAASAPVLRLRALSVIHEGADAATPSAVTFDVAPGEVVLLLGPSGSGKSTLALTLNGLIPHAIVADVEGMVQVAGLTASDTPVATLSTHVGMVFQDPDAQLVTGTILDEVAFGLENLRVPADEIMRRAETALRRVGLWERRAENPDRLSGGGRQRLAIACALAMGSSLLVLDEPTANLDPDGVAEVRAAVERLVAARETTLVVVEHRVETWVDLVDRVVVLEPGAGVCAEGAPDAVLGSRGAELAAAGIWVPGRHPVIARGPRRAAAPELLSAAGLAVGRRRFGERAPRTAAAGIDLAVHAGRTTSILGPNGAGKSTLGLTLAGLLAPVAGELRALPALAGSLGIAPIRWRSRELASRIGTVFQDPEHQFLRGSVREELEVGPRVLRRGDAEVVAIRDRLAERLRLVPLLDANPFTLSGGEKRRLSVATALATTPSVLVADEPSFGQDALTWGELVRLLDELVAEGTALVTVTHDLALVDALADERLVLPGGTREVVR